MCHVETVAFTSVTLLRFTAWAGLDKTCAIMLKAGHERQPLLYLICCFYKEYFVVFAYVILDARP